MMMNQREKEERGRLLLAWVHNEIRNNNNGTESSSSCSKELWNQCRECPALLTRGNSIGWTALHFATSHPPQQPHQAQYYPWTWMWSILLSQQHDYVMTRNNPWEARNEVGQSPVDLFFLTHLHPLSWQRPEVHRSARRLRTSFSRIIHTIRIITPQPIKSQHKDKHTNDLSIATTSAITIRHRFLRMLRHTQQESPPTSPYDDDDETAWTTTPRTTTTTTTTTIHAEYYDWEDSSSEEENDDSASGEAAQEEMDLRQLVEFWHPMEQLLRAATYIGSTQSRHQVPQNDHVDDDDDDDHDEEEDTFRVVHALARTNCPPCVAQLAVLLYPSQPREWQPQPNYNYDEKDDSPPQPQKRRQLFVQPQQLLLPLHICLISPNAFDDWTTTPMRNTHDTNTNANNHDTNHHATTNPTNETVNRMRGATHSMRRVLLEVYPEGAAASIPWSDPNNNATTTTMNSPLVALELALEVGRVEDWGTTAGQEDDSHDPHDPNNDGGLLGELLHVYPEVWHTWSGIPPFVRAALARVSPEAAMVHAKMHHPPSNLSSSCRNNSSRYASNRHSIRTPSMWKFLPLHSQATAIASAHDQLNLIHLTAIYKLLRASPSQLRL